MRIIILPIIVIIISLSVGGCASSAITAMMSVLSGADVVSQVTTGKGAIDNAVSLGMQKDCAVFRLFKGKKVCHDKEKELIKEAIRLINMDCEIYAWDANDKPYCKK